MCSVSLTDLQQPLCQIVQICSPVIAQKIILDLHQQAIIPHIISELVSVLQRGQNGLDGPLDLFLCGIRLHLFGHDQPDQAHLIREHRSLQRRKLLPRRRLFDEPLLLKCNVMFFCFHSIEIRCVQRVFEQLRRQLFPLDHLDLLGQRDLPLVPCCAAPFSEQHDDICVGR